MHLKGVFVAALIGVAAVSYPQLAKAQSTNPNPENFIINSGRTQWTTGTAVANGYDYTDGFSRGTSIYSGTSLGAYTVSSLEFNFQNVSENVDDNEEMFIASFLLDDSTPNATFTYVDGTAGVTSIPFSLSLLLPDLTSDGSGVVIGSSTLYTFTGSQYLNIVLTNSGDTTTYKISGVDIDPVTGYPVDLTVSGMLTTGNSPSDSLSSVVKETITPEPGGLLLALTGTVAMAGICLLASALYFCLVWAWKAG